MDKLIDVQWRDMFVPEPSLLEMFLRGTLIYLSIFLLLRLFLKQSGGVGIADLLVIVLIADAAQNGMAAEYTSITDGLVLVATIVFWSRVIDWFTFHVPRVRAFTYPNALILVREGIPHQQHLRRELITEEELLSQVRQQGIDDITKVKASYLEGDGRISVIEQEEKQHSPPERQGV